MPGSRQLGAIPVVSERLEREIGRFRGLILGLMVLAFIFLFFANKQTVDKSILHVQRRNGCLKSPENLKSHGAGVDLSL